MATTKDAKKTVKRIFVIILIIITKVAATGTNFFLRYPTENQILLSTYKICYKLLNTTRHSPTIYFYSTEVQRGRNEKKRI